MRCGYLSAFRIPPVRNATRLKRIWKGTEARVRTGFAVRGSLLRCIEAASGVACISPTNTHARLGIARQASRGTLFFVMPEGPDTYPHFPYTRRFRSET